MRRSLFGALVHTVATEIHWLRRWHGESPTTLLSEDDFPTIVALRDRWAEHDATLSFEASRHDSDKLALATAGIASVTLKVYGKASHAGGAPELGVNALYELSHQVLQMRDLSDPATGIKMNWTVARAGINRNVIPPAAEAIAD